MSFGSLETGADDAPLSEINMVPLIDVMLVLLVIFLVTAPLLTHSVKLELPRASSAPTTSRAETVQLSIDAAGLVYWNGMVGDLAAVEGRMAAAAATTPQPDLHISAARTTPYEQVAQVMSAAARAGLTRIAFVTDPAPR